MENSPLAKLCPELRNDIWKLTVSNGSHIFLVDARMEIASALTRRCKQIRSESLGLFYRTNKFMFNETCHRHSINRGFCDDCDGSRARLTNLKLWLNELDSSMLAALGRIKILVNSGGNSSASRYLTAWYTEISYDLKQSNCEGQDATPELHVHMRVPTYIVE